MATHQADLENTGFTILGTFHNFNLTFEVGINIDSVGSSALVT